MFEDELTLALSLAQEAGNVQMRHIATDVRITEKADRSPVTNIDNKCEALIRTALTSRFPGDSFLGEESGSITGTSGRCWIVDPIDGTRPFIRGIPTHSTLIALEKQSVPVLGVIHLPAMNKTFWAAQGTGAFCNGTPIHVSSTTSLTHAMGSALGFIEHDNAHLRACLLQLMGTLGYHYGFMDAFSYGCLAEGKLDLCVNLLDKAWDCTAAACIITEAGGTYSDINGEKNTHNGSIILSNGHLHEETLEFFRSCPQQ